MSGKLQHIAAALGGFFLLCATSCAWAQSTPTSANTITVTTRLIYVDVVVRDSSGHPVAGLTKADFAVKEDGKPQPIAFFDDGSRRRPEQPAVAVSPTGPQAGIGIFSNTAPSTSPDRAANLILLDLLNTPQQDQLYATEQLLKFLKTLPPGHQMALFLLTDRLEMLQGLTGSSDQLIRAAQQLSPKDKHLTRSGSERMQMIDNITSLALLMGHDPGGFAGHLKQDLDNEDADTLDRRVRVTATAFAQLAAACSGYPGRKNLLWLAEDFPIGLRAQLQLDRSPLVSDALGTTGLLANLGIAVYPISLAGLQTTGIDASSGGAGETSLVTGAGNTLRDQFNARNSLYDSVNDLARDTGGQAFHGTNDIAGALTRVVDDGSHYYTLAYRSPATKGDGTDHHIAVSLDKSGLQLSYRHSYMTLPEAQGSKGVDQELKASLQPEMLDSSQLRLSSALRVTPDHPTVAVDTNLNAADLTYTTDPAGHRHTQLLVTLVAFSTTDTPKPIAETTGVLNLDLDPAQYNGLLQKGLQFREQISLKPGQYTLHLGVAETTTHRIGTLAMPVTTTTASPQAAN